jgi:hypothetical protein
VTLGGPKGSVTHLRWLHARLLEGGPTEHGIGLDQTHREPSRGSAGANGPCSFSLPLFTEVPGETLWKVPTGVMVAYALRYGKQEISH